MPIRKFYIDFAIFSIKLTIASTLIIGLSIIYLTIGFFSVEADFVYKASIEIGCGLFSGGIVGLYWNWKSKKHIATLSALKKKIFTHNEIISKKILLSVLLERLQKNGYENIYIIDMSCRAISDKNMNRAFQEYNPKNENSPGTYSKSPNK